MKIFGRVLLFVVGLAFAATSQNQISCPDCEIITRDVAIIGGGSAGTYMAYRLHDQNYSVAVIEPKDHLGGNAETYTASNGWTIDIGVIVFDNKSTVKNYFDRFNVSLTPIEVSIAQPEQSLVDFTTGESVTDYVGPSYDEVAAALGRYQQQLAKYPNLNLSYNLTYPIAADSDLLLPFGQFAAKYNMSAAMQLIFITNQGYAPILDIPTMYMFQYLNQGELDNWATHFLTTTNHDIQQLYRTVGSWLNTTGSDVYLNSTVLATDRSSTPAQVLIQTPTGRKLIQASRVVITAPPMLSSLSTLDLSTNESSLFAQFFANGYYTGILTNTSLPGNFSASAFDPNNPSQYNIPTLPSLYSVSANAGAPDCIQVYYGSPTVLPPETVQADILASIARLEQAQGLPPSSPQWAIFSAHTPFNLMVTPAAIQDGFYEKLYALQGQRGTYYSGAAWNAQDSSWIWEYTDKFVMPELFMSLEQQQ